ncbi:hypothetical protein PR202_ga26143 [Eleusine coracana subsp. coracana]|uniref:Uncharacterized protein n=1 Tax=Eleusine coracana subsp. coracana TaxID=191504 RepID=A0AAV5DDH3_ELECO|nr:hypothetical protein PR202_ga26143 [Eleusine coracana subsp. coracana]
MEKTETALAGSRPSCAGSPRARSPGAPSSTPMACCSHALRGIFINFVDHWCPRFFARPSSESERPGNLDFLPSYTRGYGSILDHCNGLLLYEGRFKREFYVVNPATRWWECLPRHTGFRDYYIGYLVFDPAVSPHYEVFLIPYFPETPIPVGVPRYDPPSPVNLHGLFSLPDAHQMMLKIQRRKRTLQRENRWNRHRRLGPQEMAGPHRRSRAISMIRTQII